VVNKFFVKKRCEWIYSRTNLNAFAYQQWCWNHCARLKTSYRLKLFHF